MIQLPKGMRILTPQQSRMFRRLARKALRPMAPRIQEAMRPLAELVQSQLDGLPPTTFRCVCGRYVASYRPDADGRTFLVRSKDGGLAHHLECKEHGPLEDFTPAAWREEWTRRGQPSPFTWRLRPLS